MQLAGPKPALSQHLAGRDNNLNLIRLIAAAAVLVSHAFPITLGEGVAEPLVRETGIALGSHAVAVFFVLSGLLIARSYDRTTSTWRFATARVMRLFPGLAVVLVLTIAAGAAVTRLDLAAYLTAPATYLYLPRNLSLAFLQMSLPGVFETNPIGPPINGSLWTLFYEVMCYFGVFVLGLCGVLRRPGWITALVAALAVGFVISLDWRPQGGLAYRLDLLAYLGFPFGLGVLAYVWRDRLPIDGRIAAALWLVAGLVAGLAGALEAGSGLLAPAITLAVAYSTIWFGFAIKGPLLAFNRIGDYSYGVYIYAFPVQQGLVHFSPGMTPLENMLFALPLTLVLAALSWFFIEKRALALIDPVASRLEGMFAQRSQLSG